jgi:hypothetical protein
MLVTGDRYATQWMRIPLLRSFTYLQLQYGVLDYLRYLLACGGQSSALERM